jgi:excisionase family DNA binding protein
MYFGLSVSDTYLAATANTATVAKHHGEGLHQYVADAIQIGSLLTAKQVAARLGVSAATAYGLCERRELDHVRVANAIRVSPETLEAFLRTTVVGPSKRLRRPSSGLSGKAPPLRDL